MVRDGRVFEPVLTALVTSDGTEVELRSPTVGLWRGSPAPGHLVTPGSDLGEIEILGVLHRVEAPADARGVVTESSAGHIARRPVGYGDLMLRLSREVLALDGDKEASVGDGEQASGRLVFEAPSSGRFYLRPGPDKPVFASVGDEISRGHTICLLEVMKTFNRVTYGGAGLPERARVVAIIPENGSDLSAGDPILELEVI